MRLFGCLESSIIAFVAFHPQGCVVCDIQIMSSRGLLALSDPSTVQCTKYPWPSKNEETRPPILLSPPFPSTYTPRPLFTQYPRRSPLLLSRLVPPFFLLGIFNFYFISFLALIFHVPPISSPLLPARTSTTPSACYCLFALLFPFPPLFFFFIFLLTPLILPYSLLLRISVGVARPLYRRVKERS